jgi:hypothetical protein
VDTRPKPSGFYQLHLDFQAIKTPSGEHIDVYHFVVGMDVYQKDRKAKKRAAEIAIPNLPFKAFQVVEYGESDPSATWSGDIGAAAMDAVLKFDSTYEAKNPEMSEDERLAHYYRTRAPDADLLGDIDAWAVADRVDLNAEGDTIASIIESVYGEGRLTSTGAPQVRKLAIQNFLARHSLTVTDNTLVSDANRKIIADYILNSETSGFSNGNGTGGLRAMRGYSRDSTRRL